MEKLLLKFNLPMIENLTLVNTIVRLGYRKTGNKFSVSFNGSKGYLSNIRISCEGPQTHSDNIIRVEDLLTEKGQLMNKKIAVYYAEGSGVQVVIAD